MRLTFVLLAVVTTVNVHAMPLAQETNKDDTDQITRLHGDFSLVAYVESFKNIMAEYVRSEYRHLTVNEVEKVKTTLDEFLQSFAKDLKEILERPTEDRKYVEQQKIEDGISDATFEEIKHRVKHEFTDIGVETANEIVYTLRNDLLKTRQKLDLIIEESKRAQLENS